MNKKAAKRQLFHYGQIFFFIMDNYYFLLTISFNTLPALNTGAFEAGIVISFLV